MSARDDYPLTDNVQSHEDVHALPWADAFEMCGRTVPPTVRTRRRADRQTLVDTVRAIATGT